MSSNPYNPFSTPAASPPQQPHSPIVVTPPAQQQTPQNQQTPSAETSWSAVQKKTFTKWVQSQVYDLRPVEDLFTYFKDGTMLLALIKRLFPELTIPKYNENPTLRVQMLDNLSIALNLLDKAGVKLPFLKTTNIVDCEPRPIMGLIWALIYQFSIRSQTLLEQQLTGESDRGRAGSSFMQQQVTKAPSSDGDDSAKRMLLRWCRARTKGYPGVDVQDFTNSWLDGKAFAALVHSLDSDALDFNSLQNVDPTTRLREAFKAADEHMEIFPLLDSEDVATGNTDEKSVMTYLVDFLKWWHSEARIMSEISKTLDGVHFGDTLRGTQHTSKTMESQQGLPPQSPPVIQQTPPPYDPTVNLENSNDMRTNLSDPSKSNSKERGMLLTASDPTPPPPVITAPVIHPPVPVPVQMPQREMISRNNSNQQIQYQQPPQQQQQPINYDLQQRSSSQRDIQQRGAIPNNPYPMPPEQIQKHAYGQTNTHNPVNGNGNNWQTPPQQRTPPAHNNPYVYPIRKNPHPQHDLPQKAYPTHYVQPSYYPPQPQQPQPTYIQPTMMSPVYNYPTQQAPTQGTIQIISLNGSKVTQQTIVPGATPGQQPQPTVTYIGPNGQIQQPKEKKEKKEKKPDTKKSKDSKDSKDTKTERVESPQVALESLPPTQVRQPRSQATKQPASKTRLFEPNKPPLPAGWESRFDSNAGRIYYIDHNTRQTTYERPQPPPLPNGWEMKFDDKGCPYFLDHNSKTTTFTPPWLQGSN